MDRLMAHGMSLVLRERKQTCTRIEATERVESVFVEFAWKGE